jgi:hypothetical protein
VLCSTGKPDGDVVQRLGAVTARPPQFGVGHFDAHVCARRARRDLDRFDDACDLDLDVQQRGIQRVRAIDLDVRIEYAGRAVYADERAY